MVISSSCDRAGILSNPLSCEISRAWSLSSMMRCNALEARTIDGSAHETCCCGVEQIRRGAYCVLWWRKDNALVGMSCGVDVGVGDVGRLWWWLKSEVWSRCLPVKHGHFSIFLFNVDSKTAGK